MKEYSNALNNLAEYMKGLQEENQKLKDENKELRGLVDSCINLLDCYDKKSLTLQVIKDKYRDFSPF